MDKYEMDPTSPEYKALVKLINKNSQGTLIERISDHLASFAAGTLANIVSAYLMSR